MSAERHLPDNASLEYLRKLARERLRELRRAEPATKLADAQLLIAREHGFSSWRALKAEVDRRTASPMDALFAACRAGDDAGVRALLAGAPSLANARDAHGSTPLHAAAAHPDVLRTLLAHGADPNVRDTGDNALPLHFAAGGGPIDSVRVLLDAGSDVHGHGDLHEADVIGWAAYLHRPRHDVVALLVERGARHHIFSAIAMDDPALVRRVVRDDPDALQRRTSKFESRQTPIHFALFPADGLGGRAALPQYDILDVLLELGADLEANDGRGRTPLALALLRGDDETANRLRAAGAREPDVPPTDASPDALATLGESVKAIVAMLAVADVAASVEWYRALGFRLAGTNEDDGELNWASIVIGRAEIMLVPGEATDGRKPVSVWIYTDRIDDVYAALRARLLRRAAAARDGAATTEPEIRFVQDLYESFYGMREFCVVDPDGYHINFAWPVD